MFFKQNSKYILAGIVLVALLLRVFWINVSPPAVNHDQLYYLLNAKAFVFSGKDISQTISLKDIFLFKYPPGDLTQSELPFLLAIFTVGFLPFTMLGSFLPNIILGTFIVLLMYLISKRLFNEKTALITAFVAAVNPWLIVTSRTLYEMIPATFFYLLAFYSLISLKGWKLLLTIPVFVLAFYSYISTKTIFLPLILLFICYNYFFVNKKEYLKQYLILAAFCIGLLFFFFLQIKAAPGASRLSEVVLPNHPAVAAQVNTIRRLSLPSPFIALYANKFVVYATIITNLFVQTISPTYLFISGDYIFALGNHGFFYLIDAFLFIAGGVGMFMKKKPAFAVISLAMLLSIVPQLIHDPTGKGSNFSPHIAMLFPFMIFFIAHGVLQFKTLIAEKYAKLFLIILAGIYLISIGNFAVQYYTQLPFKTGLYEFPTRELSRYVALAHSKNAKVVVYAKEPRDPFKSYLFYANEYNKNTVKELGKAFKTEDYTLGNISFKKCFQIPKSLPKNQTTIIHVECDRPFPPPAISLPFLSDSGTIYLIYHDPVCKGISLNSYVAGITAKDFQVEKMGSDQFCKTFLITP